MSRVRGSEDKMTICGLTLCPGERQQRRLLDLSSICQEVFLTPTTGSRIMKVKIPYLIMFAIVLVFILELVAMVLGMNGQCMRMAVGSICTMAGFLGGWGIKKAIKKQEGET